MAVTKVDNQRVTLKKKIGKLNKLSYECHKTDGGQCPIKHVLAPTTDKWTLFCLYNLAYFKVLRFNELKSKIPGVSSRMLSVTLKKMEDSGLVSRKIYPEVPPKVEYSLTEFAYKLSQKLIDLNLWLFENYKRRLPKKRS